MVNRIKMNGRKLVASAFTDEENQLLIDNLDDETREAVKNAHECSVKIDGKLVTNKNIKEFEK